MITNKELNAVKLSPTKKDFYQIWNELLDTAGKISERWDPASTNESDPGIVLLKVLTAVADKLNYNIDANTLEAFMPSAAQEESMRKLTEMMGYNMKYYQSATTEVKISYNKNITSPIEGFLVIDKFTNIKDIDDSINYVTLNALNLDSNNPSGTVQCMEGALIECETDDNNIVSMFHLDDNNRYYLPETQIAENGVFVTNITNNIESKEWSPVANLNAQSLGSTVFKVGFDSQEGLPYVQFPEDISTIIEDGLRIKYIRTSGAGGNISANILTKLSTPGSWSTLTNDEKSDKEYYDVANYTVSNLRAATNGSNREGINSAYNNFKKTIGTFDTLVTCRDYMNKIYQLVSEIDNSTPLVSNVIVSDIKDDINRAVTLGTFTHRGIEYKAIAKPGKQLTNFDLMLYPFKSTYNLNSRKEFEKSFTYSASNVPEILSALEDNKTLVHTFRSPADDEIACIKNYYKLRAKINTVRKVGFIEQTNILTNIYTKLFEHFNMRQLDFGEEIPYDTLLQVIETADPRIKNISLDEPELTTKFCTADNQEYTIGSALTDEKIVKGNSYYNSLVLNNVLAGRVPLFNYDTNFTSNFNEEKYSGTYEDIYKTDIYKLKTDLEIPTVAVEEGRVLKLTANEVVQFRAPSFTTTETYPSYVNYFLHLDKTGREYTRSIPATMQTLRNFLCGGLNTNKDITATYLDHYINNTNFPQETLVVELAINEEIRANETEFKQKYAEIENTNVAIFIKDASNKYVYKTKDEAWALVSATPTTKLYTLKFSDKAMNEAGVRAWVSWLLSLTSVYLDTTDKTFDRTNITDNIIDLNTTESRINGIYIASTISLTTAPGYLVDSEGIKYKLVENPKDVAQNPFDYYYIPRIWSSTESPNGSTEDASAKDWHTQNSLGQKGENFKLTKGIEYQLREGEYLLINYTHSASENNDTKVQENISYTKGSIIKPNFDLLDSEDYHRENHSYTKLNVEKNFIENQSLPGMFTLSTDQQIEIRKLAKIDLTEKVDEKIINIYWDLPTLNSIEDSGRLDFPFDEEPVDPTTGNAVEVTSEMVKNTDYIYTAYTLKEGESFYYTDMNKSDIAFYGFGTTIRRGINTPPIFKYTSDDLISTDEISSSGLSAAIPWRTYRLVKDKGSLTFTENQFINLTEGDTLVSIELTNNETEINSSKYFSVDTASYQFATEEADSSSIVTHELPPLDLDGGHKWQVRSKLDLSMSSNKAQTLQTKSIKDNFKVKDKISLIKTTFSGGVGTDTEIETLEAEENRPLAIKSNKLLQSASIITDVTSKKLADTGEVEELIPDLQLKLFKETVSKTNLDQIINFGNFGDGTFTSINFEELLKKSGKTSGSITLPLNILLPENTFGLLMIYYRRLKESNTTKAKVTSQVTGNLELYNEDTSWDGVLKDGINIIKINADDTITISSEGNNESVVIFGELSRIPVTNPLNPKLCYKKITENTEYEQILEDIKKIDTTNEFYYNMPIAGNLDIDMNPLDEKDTLENPLNWFNYNNINNKFVIAELDHTTLTDGIVIAKSSRSNF